jgi:hypothetical protein
MGIGQAIKPSLSVSKIVFWRFSFNCPVSALEAVKRDA